MVEKRLSRVISLFTRKYGDSLVDKFFMVYIMSSEKCSGAPLTQALFI